MYVKPGTSHGDGPPLVDQLLELERGIVVFDAQLNTNALILAPVICFLCDNPRTAEICSHLGSGTLKFCRICRVNNYNYFCHHDLLLLINRLIILQSNWYLRILRGNGVVLYRKCNSFVQHILKQSASDCMVQVTRRTITSASCWFASVSSLQPHKLQLSIYCTGVHQLNHSIHWGLDHTNICCGKKWSNCLKNSGRKW